VLFVGSAALAQQGFIVEPWRSASPRAAASAALVAPAAPAVRRPMPGSGLPPVEVAALRTTRQGPKATVAAPWKPPVVALLVDPWAKSRQVTPAIELTVGPLAADIVDPWAVKARSAEPPAPRRRTMAPHSTIF
jgi:hypothetical protein